MAKADTKSTAPHPPQFSPIEAAYAVAQFLPADPVLWLERCALAGIIVGLTPDGCLYELYHHGEARGFVDADRSQVAFLSSWLNLTPGGREAVRELLRCRAAQS